MEKTVAEVNLFSNRVERRDSDSAEILQILETFANQIISETSLDELRLENERLRAMINKLGMVASRIMPVVTIMDMLTPGGMEKGSIAADLTEALDLYAEVMQNESKEIENE